MTQPALKTWLQAPAVRQLPVYASILIGALCVADAAHLWSASHPSQAAVTTPLAVPLSGLSPVGLASLGVSHLFGDSQESQDELARHLPDAGAAFLLTGLIATGNPKVGSAIIGHQGQSTALYQVGATLTGVVNGRLYEVYADHVVLSVDGHFETLQLPHPTAGAGAALVTVQSLKGEGDATDQVDEAATSGTPRQPVTVAQGLFENLNPAPRVVRGRFDGMRLMPSEDDQRKFGVRDGDVVVAVNGVKLTNPNAVNGLLAEQSGQRAAVSLTVLRDGTQQVIKVVDTD